MLWSQCSSPVFAKADAQRRAVTVTAGSPRLSYGSSGFQSSSTPPNTANPSTAGAVSAVTQSPLGRVESSRSPAGGDGSSSLIASHTADSPSTSRSITQPSITQSSTSSSLPITLREADQGRIIDGDSETISWSSSSNPASSTGASLHPASSTLSGAASSSPVYSSSGSNSSSGSDNYSRSSTTASISSSSSGLTSPTLSPSLYTGRNRTISTASSFTFSFNSSSSGSSTLTSPLPTETELETDDSPTSTASTSSLSASHTETVSHNTTSSRSTLTSSSATTARRTTSSRATTATTMSGNGSTSSSVTGTGTSASLSPSETRLPRTDNDGSTVTSPTSVTNSSISPTSLVSSTSSTIPSSSSSSSTIASNNTTISSTSTSLSSLVNGTRSRSTSLSTSTSLTINGTSSTTSNSTVTRSRSTSLTTSSQNSTLLRSSSGTSTSSNATVIVALPASPVSLTDTSITPLPTSRIASNIAQTTAPVHKADVTPSTVDDPDPSSTRQPSLNDGGSAMTQSGKLIGGVIAGVAVLIIIVVAMFWLMGKRRRNKFVRPIIERMHPTGSQYSIPGMLTANTRRSRAFSIDSTSTYSTHAGPHSPGTRGHSPPLHNGAIPGYGIPSSPPQMSTIYRQTSDQSDMSFLPSAMVGTTSSHSRKPTYRSFESAASMALSNQLVSPPATTPSRALDHDEEDPFASSGSSGHGHHSGAASFSGQGHSRQPSDATHATTVYTTRNHLLSDSTGSKQETEVPGVFVVPSSSQGHNDSTAAHRNSVAASFDNDDVPYLPKSPALRPTRLERRTTDPFTNKNRLRVINPDEDSLNRISTPTSATMLRPGSAASQASMASRYSDFYYDNHMPPMSTLAVANPSSSTNFGDEMEELGTSRKSRHLSINLPNQKSPFDDSASVYTPNEVNTVGFFSGH